MDESTLFGREPTWVAFVDSLKEEFYPIRNYDDQYMRWTTLRQKRDQTVLGVHQHISYLALKYGYQRLRATPGFEVPQWSTQVHPNKYGFLGHLLTRSCLSICSQN
jgi:hypothetical protein